MVYLRVERHVPRILYVRELCARRSLVPRTLQFDERLAGLEGLDGLKVDSIKPQKIGLSSSLTKG